jgi:hypothetical protein
MALALALDRNANSTNVGFKVQISYADTANTVIPFDVSFLDLGKLSEFKLSFRVFSGTSVKEADYLQVCLLPWYVMVTNELARICKSDFGEHSNRD